MYLGIQLPDHGLVVRTVYVQGGLAFWAKRIIAIATYALGTKYLIK